MLSWYTIKIIQTTILHNSIFPPRSRMKLLIIYIMKPPLKRNCVGYLQEHIENIQVKRATRRKFLEKENYSSFEESVDHSSTDSEL